MFCTVIRWKEIAFLHIGGDRFLFSKINVEKKEKYVMDLLRTDNE